MLLTHLLWSRRSRVSLVTGGLHSSRREPGARPDLPAGFSLADLTDIGRFDPQATGHTANWARLPARTAYSEIGGPSRGHGSGEADDEPVLGAAHRAREVVGLTLRPAPPVAGPQPHDGHEPQHGHDAHHPEEGVPRRRKTTSGHRRRRDRRPHRDEVERPGAGPDEVGAPLEGAPRDERQQP